MCVAHAAAATVPRKAGLFYQHGRRNHRMIRAGSTRRHVEATYGHFLPMADEKSISQCASEPRRWCYGASPCAGRVGLALEDIIKAVLGGRFAQSCNGHWPGR